MQQHSIKILIVTFFIFFGNIAEAIVSNIENDKCDLLVLVEDAAKDSEENKEECENGPSSFYIHSEETSNSTRLFFPSLNYTNPLHVRQTVKTYILFHCLKIPF